MRPLLLASGSEIRAQLLTNARVPFAVSKPRVDEDTARRAMEAEGLSPRDMADHLAELKAMRVAAKHPEVVKRLTRLADSARADIGDHDRLGRNARFFDVAPKRIK